MHILLTDQLTCPRCGADFGLILLADRMEDRRVIEGRLGCANCREEYPVRGGMADLRFPPGPPLPATGLPADSDSEAALRLAALLGLSGGRGMALIAGPGARLAKAVAALIDETEVVTVDPNLAALGEQPGVSRFAARDELPFASRSMRGVALTGGDGLLDEAVRVLASGGRIMVEQADSATAHRLREAGLEVLLEQDGVVVASPVRDR